MDRAAARKLQRVRLIEARRSLVNRSSLEAQLQARVLAWLQTSGALTTGFYFPIQGEPDLRPAMIEWLATKEERLAALPVIRGDVLEFHSWSAEAPMQAGEHGIPVPAHGRVVQPQCLLLPCVGFDPQRYRLGFGGGYYDRTLAVLRPPQVVGVAFEAAKLETIDPGPHDVQLDLIITEAAEYF